MAEFIIIVNNTVRAIWDTKKQAQEWVDAGNYINHDRPQEITIAKVVSRKVRNEVIQPQELYGDWS